MYQAQPDTELLTSNRLKQGIDLSAKPSAGWEGEKKKVFTSTDLLDNALKNEAVLRNLIENLEIKLVAVLIPLPAPRNLNEEVSSEVYPTLTGLANDIKHIVKGQDNSIERLRTILDHLSI